MNSNEIVFFDEYKKLDNLCKDILGADQGVTEYISEMERTPFSKRSMVISWDSTYKMLKHVRWIRNDIAHGNGNSECEQEDIAFVKEFYQKIITQKDPFGIINEKEKVIRNRTVPRNSKPTIKVNPRTYNNYEPGHYTDSNNSVKIMLGIIVVSIIVMLMIFMK